MAIMNSYAYVADGEGGLRVLDVRDPAAPTEVGHFATTGRATGVAVRGSLAYVYDYVDHEGMTLCVVDVSNPAAPVGVATYSAAQLRPVIGGDSLEAELSHLAGLPLVGMSKGAMAAEIAYFAMAGQDIAVAGDLAYAIAGESGLYILRFTGGR